MVKKGNLNFLFDIKYKIDEVKKHGSKNQIKKNGSEESSYL